MYHKSESLYLFSFVCIILPSLPRIRQTENVRNILIKKRKQDLSLAFRDGGSREDRRTSSANFYGLAKQREDNCRTGRRCAREKYDGERRRTELGKEGARRTSSEWLGREEQVKGKTSLTIYYVGCQVRVGGGDGGGGREEGEPAGGGVAA